MSFSSEIKERLCAENGLCSQCQKAEIFAMLEFSGHKSENEIYINTENEAVADRLMDYMNEKASLERNARNYRIKIQDIDISCDIERECCKSAYIRGAFLSGGSVSSPEKNYHLEFATMNEAAAKKLARLLSDDGFFPKQASRKGYTVVYFKDCDSIAELLGYMGEGVAGLKMFEKQIEKQVRNDINRIVNCENANTNKLAKAASKHIHAVNMIKKSGAWEKLPDVLKEMGEIRCQYPVDSLKELGERLEPPIGKSGVNHRLNRILEFADNL